MMGEARKQKDIFHTVQLEDLVPEDHPLRRIRPLIDAEHIRELCKDFYSDTGRPGIPPEQLFLAMLGGYLLGCRSDRMIIRQLTCDMAFRWFVGLDIDSPVWDPSTFSKNREHRFDGAGIFEKLLDESVVRAVEKGWVSTHWSVDGTLVRAKERYGLEPESLGEDKAYFEKGFVGGLLDRKIAPHVATQDRGSGNALMRTRMRCRGLGYQLSQRARKRIEELWGEGKEQHGMRRFARRLIENVRQEAYLMGWLLNLKRLATLEALAPG